MHIIMINQHLAEYEYFQQLKKTGTLLIQWQCDNVCFIQAKAIIVLGHFWWWIWLKMIIRHSA